jgi:hypothetical protein
MAAIFYYTPTGPTPLATVGDLSTSDWRFNGQVTDSAATNLTSDWWITNAGIKKRAHYKTVPTKTIAWTTPAIGPYPAPPVSNGTCLPLYTEVLSASNPTTVGTNIAGIVIGSIYGGTAIVPTTSNASGATSATNPGGTTAVYTITSPSLPAGLTLTPIFGIK